MRQVAIIYKRSREEAARLADDLSRRLQSRSIGAYCRENIDSPGFCCAYDNLKIPEAVDMIVVLGGDGTFLSVARLLENRTIPVVGVNLGGLGFLTEIGREDCFREIEKILDGDFEIEERMRLLVTIRRGDVEIFRQPVLNDAVVNKGALARIVDLRTSIDDRFLTQYRADGLIVATPTGSTAYSLSAGGPIVYPTVRSIILTPICSFALTNRPIILPHTATVGIEIADPLTDVTLTCDGQVGYELRPEDRIQITADATPLRLIKTSGIDYLQILRTKLKWGTAPIPSGERSR